MKTLIIAEAGVNHNGDLAIARDLIDKAAEAGADLIKFQTFKADNLVLPSAPKAEYQCKQDDKNQTQYEMLKALELSQEMHEELIKYCNQRNIGFFSTGFDLDSNQLLANLGQSLFKIPSGEITNVPYLRQVGQFGKPIILSTGMATLGEIEHAINILVDAGANRNEITVLHCNTEYPTPMTDVNLLAMTTIQNAFKVPVGYSDHTAGIEVAIAAVALGASVIEKHFTVDCNLPGPDHKASLDPEGLKAMITSIRNIELALGDGIKRPSISEAKNIMLVRKSIVAACSISAGEEFTNKNLTAKRPAMGLSTAKWDEIIGKRASRNFAVNELIEL